MLVVLYICLEENMLAMYANAYALEYSVVEHATKTHQRVRYVFLLNLIDHGGNIRMVDVIDDRFSDGIRNVHL
ncbi:hypothetical protein RNF90_000079 [Shigella flexneri]|nr:hypothetical protein [Shigella flexneri]